MMNHAPLQKLNLLAKLVLTFAAVMIFTGAIWHGVTVATFLRIWHDMIERPGGPMSFRFILQPVMAAIVGAGEGLRDARAGRTPYFWTMLRQRHERLGRLNEGLNATARIMLLGIAMDMIYQGLVLKTFYPNEALIIALLLAFVPYVIVRGLSGRIVRRWHAPKPASRGP